MALICAADALGKGTAGPASSAVPAAGLVVVAEAPLPTLHIPHSHSHGRAKGQVDSTVGSIHLLLTGSGLHVAGVPSWAAVLAVLTAHGVGQLAAGPAPAQAQAAGLPHWAAGVLVTAHGPELGQGSAAGRPLLQSSHHLVPPLTLPPSHARVALGAAVLVVRAAGSLWLRTAAPFSRQELTAGIAGRAAGDVVTGDIPLCGSGV